MVCCGKTRRTQFCPDCGKAMFPSGPLGGLLAHCQKVLDQYRKSYERRPTKKSQHVIEKYENWVTALSKLIKAEGQP